MCRNLHKTLSFEELRLRRGSALSPSKFKLAHQFSHCERMSMSKDVFAHEQLHIMQFFCISPGAAMPPNLRKLILLPAISFIIIAIRRGEVAWLAQQH